MLDHDRQTDGSVDQLPGALIISLDFELHWGWRDEVQAGSPYMQNFYGAREAIVRILDLFSRYEVSATWATVGFLFAEGRSDLDRFSPEQRPTYQDSRLCPYQEQLGEDERDDPLHYAASLIRQVAQTPGQEVGTHTFSHYYCQAEGQTRRQFDADLAAAVGIAKEKVGGVQSIVFPRNQVNPAYQDLLLTHGITCYRGNPPGWAYRSNRGTARVARLLDAYLDVSHCSTQPWDSVVESSGLANVRAGMFLRPCSRAPGPLQRLRLRRVCESLQLAAAKRELFHLWWHPHNFGAEIDKNLAFLEQVLRCYRGLRDRHGMASLTMCEAADAARNRAPQTSHAA